MEINYFPQRTSNQWVINGPVNDLPTCYMMLSMAHRYIGKYHDDLEKRTAIAIPGRPNIIDHLRNLPRG